MSEYEETPLSEEESGQILTVEQYKALRGITGTDRDVQITAAIPSAEDAVIRYSQRAFNQAPEVATRSFVYEGQSILEIDDAQNVTEVKFDGRQIPPESYILGPQGIGEVLYYIELLDYPFYGYDPYIDPFLRNTHLEHRRRRKRIVEVTATYGWPQAPASVVQAVAFLLDEYAPANEPRGGLQAEAIVDYSRVFDKHYANEPAVLPPHVRELLDQFRRVLL